MRGIQASASISRGGGSAFATLTVGCPLGEERVVLARVTDGLRLCREQGYRQLPARTACERTRTIGVREMADLRGFVARQRLVGVPLASLDDQALLSLVRQLLSTGEIVALEAGDVPAAAEDAGLVRQRQLVREIARRTRGQLSDSGRRYRLVAGEDLGRLSDRDYYEVVGHTAAASVLSAIAARDPGDAPLRDLLAQARERLAPDWRKPFLPDGLVLLRRSIVQAAQPFEAPPLTPSQLAKMLKKKTWIEIEVLHKDGTPYAGPCLLKHPDAKTSEGFLNQAGFWGAYDIDEGTYAFTVPPAGGAAAAEEGADETEAPVVRRVRLLGMVFDANKCFLLPQALSGLKTIIGMHEEDPGAQVLIVGHAGGDEDLAGMDIALDRAHIVGAYLKNQPNLWLNWFGTDKNPRSRWGTREVQLMLSALPEGEPPFYVGYPSGHTDERTVAAIRTFQEHKGLPNHGDADFATRKALVEAYMAVEDTSLAQDLTPIAHGCEGHVEDSATASGEQPDDRRLEAFFFKQGIEPVPDQAVSSADGTLYPAWLAKVVETRDFETHGLHVQIVDSAEEPCPLATVHLKGPIVADSTADEYGYVSFFGLKPGEYVISSEKDGYKIGVSRLCYPTAKTVPGSAKTG